MGNSKKDATAMLDMEFKKVSHQSTHQAKMVRLTGFEPVAYGLEAIILEIF